MAEEKQYTLKELKEKLTEKEKNFCHEYIVDWNGSRAAREAGYSENSCAEIANQNLRKLHIEQYIDFIKNDYEKEAGITKLSQIKDLLAIKEDPKANYRDRISATQELNKMLGYNEPDKVKHSGEIKTNDVSKLSTEELIKRAESIKKIDE